MAPESDGWDAATWAGSRRVQLRRALKLTVRQRLEVLEGLAATSSRLADTVKHTRVADTADTRESDRD